MKRSCQIFGQVLRNHNKILQDVWWNLVESWQDLWGILERSCEDHGKIFQDFLWDLVGFGKIVVWSCGIMTRSSRIFGKILWGSWQDLPGHLVRPCGDYNKIFQDIWWDLGGSWHDRLCDIFKESWKDLVGSWQDILGILLRLCRIFGKFMHDFWRHLVGS